MRTATRATFLIVTVAVVAGCQGEPPLEPTKIDLSVGDTAAVEKFLESNKGKAVLVDCWATWCPPCVRKFPSVVKTHDAFGPQGLVVLGVSFDDRDQVESVRDFLSRRRAGFPNIVIGRPHPREGQYLADRLGYAGGIPHVALLDKSGKKVWDTQTDGGSEYELHQRITSELAKAYRP